MFAAAALAVPLSSIAAADVFPKEEDVAAWESMLVESETDTAAVEAEVEFQSEAELFPAVGTGSGSSSSSPDEFVSVRVDGRLLVFSDVPLREWFAPYVRTIAELGIISGYRDAAGVPLGMFGPADPVTLEQVAKVLLYASGKDGEGCAGELVNATASAWAKQFILCAEQSQWSVYSDGAADVTRNATRAEVIATVLQAFGVQTGNTTGDVFTDVGSSTLYAAAIERAQKDGIVNGYTNEDGSPKGIFGPDDRVKRAEFAKMVTIALEVYGK